MERTELKPSGVLFREDTHQYFRESDGKELQGITGLISRQLFPHEYDAVPEKVLGAAAEYGKSVHRSCEDFDKEWTNDGTVELQDYIELCKEYDLVHVESEYLISDGENYASAIDKVFRSKDTENTYSICDLKTYYGKITGEKLDRCRWQLSIYRYLFLLQNPKVSVDKLFVIHLRKKQKKDGTFDHVKELIYVDPIPSEICKELLDCDLRGEQFQNPFNIPENLTEQVERIKELMEIKSKAEEELNALKANILETMEFLEVKNWATNDVKLTRKLPSIRSSLNIPQLKKDYPDIPYDSYMKESKVSGSLTVSIAA